MTSLNALNAVEYEAKHGCIWRGHPRQLGKLQSDRSMRAGAAKMRPASQRAE